MLITLGVILIVALVALLKNTSADRRWLRLEPAAEQVAELKAAGQPLVVFFHSPDCSSCKQVRSALDQVYPEFKQSVVLLDLDVTNRRERPFVEASGVITTPTLLFIDRLGKEQAFVGEIDAEVLRVELAALASLAGETP